MVTVITPTFNRPRWLRNALRSVTNQDVQAVHIVVGDGPQSEETRAVCSEFACQYLETPSRADDWGVSPRLLAIQHLTTPFVAYLDDDNEYLPGHLSTLLDLLEETRADCAYGRWDIVRRSNGEVLETLGSFPPRFGGIDTSALVHRRELFERAQWRNAGYGSDWDLVARWVDARAVFAQSPAKTYIYFRNDVP